MSLVTLRPAGVISPCPACRKRNLDGVMMVDTHTGKLILRLARESHEHLKECHGGTVQRAGTGTAPVDGT